MDMDGSIPKAARLLWKFICPPPKDSPLYTFKLKLGRNPGVANCFNVAYGVLLMLADSTSF
jgi:hypothetical protein